MKVVAIKPAFFNGALVSLGDELDIPDRTKGSWFASPESPQAQAAVKIKASGSTPVRVLGAIARGLTPDLSDPALVNPVALHEISGRQHVSFIDLMGVKP